MAGYQRCISLALVCLLLRHDALADDGCTEGDNPNLFKSKHVKAEGEKTEEEWYKYVQSDKKRPIQSFINPNEWKEVKEVCSPKGGKRFTAPWTPKTKNLCISKRQFQFFTVDTKGKKTMIYEYNYLILACSDRCVPVHFEKDQGVTTKPDPNAEGCQRG